MAKREKGSDLLAYIREGREMTQGEQLKLIVSLSIPSILAQISTVLMFFIDAAMVGHLGARQAASIGLVESAAWLFGGLTSACSMGFSVQVAHAIGANDFKRARRILRQAVTCCIVFSLLLVLIAATIHRPLPYWLGGGSDIASDASLYFLIFACATPLFQIESLGGSMLKCAGNMKVPSVLNVVMCCLDVTFNYLFIFLLDMGVPGAALGTAVAIGCTALLMSYFLFWRSDLLGLFGQRHKTIENQLYKFRPTEDIVRTAFGIGAPMGLQHVLMNGAQIVSTMIVAPLGTIAIAAHSLAITVESLCYMPGYGVAEAATTLVGQGFGAAQYKLTRSFARLSAAMGIGVMSLMGLLMWVFAPELMVLMTPVEEIIAIGTTCLRIEAFAEPLFAAAIVCNGIFIGAGDTLRPAIMSLMSMWGVRLTLAALLATSYGLPGVWTAMAIELTFRGSMFLARLFHGGWMRKSVES
jgi:putative MATE family efflux protein